MTPPIVVDIDGTMSRPDRSIDGRVIDALRDWPATVVVATGKAFPYPVALTDFIGIPTRVIAENGGVVATENTVEIADSADAIEQFLVDYEAEGHSLGWSSANLSNRWRETELAINHDCPQEPIYTIAERHGLQVIDSGYAYHVLDPTISKGNALRTLSDIISLDLEMCVAIGDSENDVSTFHVVGRSYAVANADQKAIAAADTVTEKSYADGLFEALAELQ